MQAHSASGPTHAPAGVPGASNAGAPDAVPRTAPDTAPDLAPDTVPDAVRASLRSGVSWDAVLAGATSATAVFLVLCLLGAGLGLVTYPPWTDAGGIAVGASAMPWLAFAQLAAAALGGFLAGRLRAQWIGIHDDEAYFRDTAHGLLSWAVSTLVAAVFLGGAFGNMAGGAAPTAMVANGEAGHAPEYLIDVMLRSDRAGPADTALRQEAKRILASAVAKGRLSVTDDAWLTRRIADRTGLNREDAGRRVDDAFASSAAAAAKARAAAREAADSAREAAASTALWLAAALLLGAVAAGWCAAIGGRMRDGHAGAARQRNRKGMRMRSILLWLLGVPVPIIALVAMLR